MRSSMLQKDVILLLKDVTGEIKVENMEEREKKIECGVNAYEMIPMEEAPTVDEICFYEKALELSAEENALAVENVAERIYEEKGKDVVLVSLIRGGLAAGILVKRYLDSKYHINISHYALTLVGTKGIDEKALEYILEKENAEEIQFIDGWTGKGSVSRTLAKSLMKYNNVSSDLAVLSDPAGISRICGTHNDILIANAVLNAPLAGLLSRAIPFEDSFFGAVFFEELSEYDRTYHFISKIEECFGISNDTFVESELSDIDEAQNIAAEFGIDIHFVKPGIGETIRGFIRKKPDLILVKKESKYYELISEMARKNNVEAREYPLVKYNACGIYLDKNSDVL